MTKKTIGQHPDGELQVAVDSIVLFEQDGVTLKSKISTLVDGPTVKYVHSINDLPPLVGLFRKLEQDTVYVICAPIVIPDDVLIPAGWNGTMRSSHVPSNALIYTGTNALLNTLNLDGTIVNFTNSIDNPGTHTTISCQNVHGLVEGDTVNISGTTDPLYSQLRLIVSNISGGGFLFDVEIPFVADDAGLFDTGYLGIQFPRMAFFDSGAGTLFNITAAPIAESVLIWNDLTAFGFFSLGVVHNAPTINGIVGLMTFIDNGLTLDNCDNVGIHHSKFINLNVFNTTSVCITITGDATRDISITTTKLNVANELQRPIRIDGSITNADSIVIQNTPDNDIATDYFDTSSGGLDQKDKQVITFNNGKRKNTVEQSESMSNNGITISVPSVTIGVEEPIQNDPPVSNDFLLDSTVEGFTMDDSTGEVTYEGRAPITVKIEYSLEAEQTSGGAQELDIDLRINDILQDKTIRSFASASGYLPVSYLGGFFDIIPGDRFKLYKTNNTNTTNTNIRNQVLLIK